MSLPSVVSEHVIEFPTLMAGNAENPKIPLEEEVLDITGIKPLVLKISSFDSKAN